MRCDAWFHSVCVCKESSAGLAVAMCMSLVLTSFPMYLYVIWNACTQAQLRCSGVFEAVQIRKQGYPFRYPHRTFFRKYRCLAPPSPTCAYPSQSDAKACCQRLIELMSDPQTEADRIAGAPGGGGGCFHQGQPLDGAIVHVGRTMVLYRAPQHRWMASRRAAQVNTAARALQRVGRGAVGRKDARKMRAARGVLRAALKAEDRVALEDALKQSTPPAVRLEVREVTQAKELLHTIKERERVSKRLTELSQSELDLVGDYDELVELLDAAASVGIAGSPIVLKVEQQVQTVRERVEAKKLLERGVAEWDRAALEDGIVRAGKLRDLHGDFCTAEVQAATVALERIVKEDRILVQIRGGLGEGAVGGPVGSIALGAVSVESLKGVLAEASQFGIRTPTGRLLVESAGHMVRLRRAIVADEWGLVEEIIESVGGRTDDPKTAAEVLPEVRLIVEELDNREIIAGLSEALQTGRASGVGVGNMSVLTIDIDDLECVIDDAQERGCKTTESRHLLNTAQLIVKVRSAWAALKWDDLENALLEAKTLKGGIAPVAQTEVDGAWDELNNYKVCSFLSDALASGMATGPIGRLNVAEIRVERLDEAISTAVSTGAKTDEARLLLRTSRVVQTVREALMAGDWEAVGKHAATANNDAPLHDVALSEVALARDEYQNRTILRETSDAMSAGMATGDVGNMDVSTVETGELEDAVSHAELLGCKTADAATHLASARSLLQLRLALLAIPKEYEEDGDEAGAWEAIGTAMTDIEKQGVMPMSAQEVSSVRDELDNRQIISDITEALLVGLPGGSIGDLDVSCVEVSSMRAVVQAAQSTGCKTEEAEDALWTASSLVAIRQHLLDGAWDEVESSIEVVTGRSATGGGRKRVPLHVADPEIKFLRSEVENRRTLREVAAALSTGCIGGSVGALDITSVALDELRSVVREGSRRGCKTHDAEKLVAIGEQVLALRDAVQADDWSGAADVLSSIGTEVHPAAVKEVTLARDEFHNRTIIEGLSNALSSGKATGAVGNVNLGTIDMLELDGALAGAAQLGCQTVEAKQLFATAELVKSVRTAWRSERYIELGNLLSTGKDGTNAQQWAPISATELSLAQDELDNRNILLSTSEAMSSGMAGGVLGALDTALVVVEQLEDAVNKVRRLLCDALCSLMRYE